MTFVRNLGHDLVDKKLWPLAILLVLALVAVPVLLGGGGSSATPVAAAPTGAAGAAPGTAGAATASVASVVEEPALRRRDGKVRDPFKQQYQAKSTTDIAKAVVAPTTDTTKTGGSTGSGTTGTTGAGTGDTTTTPTTPATPGPKLDPLDVYRVALRFGEPGGQKTIRDIGRLSPLPNADRPFFIFLGVLSGGQKAVFLVSSDATVTGDGACRPSKSNCETVELDKGETEFFDLETDNGVVQYQLDLVSVKRRTLAQAVAAKKALATAKRQNKAVDEASQETDVSSEDELGTDVYRWDAGRGVLVRRPTSKAIASLHIPTGLAKALRAATSELSLVSDGAWHSDTP